MSTFAEIVWTPLLLSLHNHKVTREVRVAVVISSNHSDHSGHNNNRNSKSRMTISGAASKPAVLSCRDNLAGFRTTGVVQCIGLGSCLIG